VGSLCDICRKPGACCQSFVLSQSLFSTGDPTEIDSLLTDIVTCTREDGTGSFIFGRGIADYARAQASPAYAHISLGLPFRRATRLPNSNWRYNCPVLGTDGRCTNYANRPAPCRALIPGDAPACRQHAGPACSPTAAKPH
jgi:hypothetical protein